ncbi:MAG: PAS domain-containing protein [Anaerosomatales bacterium]|nr:PAS domain-containing protein [Anaerosomatales bacterium]
MADVQDSARRLRSRAGTPYIAVLLVVGFVFAAFALGAGHARTMSEDESRARVTRQVAPYASALSSAVNTRFALISGLHEYVRVNLPEGPSAEEFDTFASGLGAGAAGIRAIQVAPDGVVRYVYPPEGNVAPGNDLLNDPRPEVRADAQRTLESDGIVLSGPYELRQGGLGIVGRQAVRTQDGAFWGFVIMVLDVPPILDEAGLADGDVSLRFALRDDDGRVFFGDEGVFDAAPVSYPIALPDGEWVLAAVPAAGWEASGDAVLPWIWASGTALALALGASVFLAISYQQRLERQVFDQTGELRAQRDLFERVAESSPVGITTLDLDGAITYANAAAERILGLRRDQISERTYDDPAWRIIATDGGPFPSEHLPFARVRATREAVFDVRHGIEWPDGQVKMLSVNAVPVRDAGGAMSGVVASIEDITERITAEESLRASERRLRATMDTMLEGCQIIDFDWRYVYINPAAEAQNRCPAEELLGRRYAEAWPGIEETSVYEHIRAALEDRVPSSLQNEFRFPDGAVGWFELEIRPIPEGVFILSVDISKRRRAEAEVQHYQERLEQLVEERTAQLAEANAELRQATMAKSDFLTSMSHELRTPLNSIIGFSELLASGLVGPLSEEQEKQIKMILSSGKHLLALINDVLDLSKVEAGAAVVHAEEFDARAIVLEVAESLRPLAEEKGLELGVEVPDSACAMTSDPGKLRQILLNLGGNAVKFTEEGHVDVRLHYDGAVAVFEVADTGIGIPHGELTRVFEVFAQIERPGEVKPAGTGLGLALSRQYAELLGGRIVVQSEEGKGSTFTVLVPCEASAVTRRAEIQ